MSTTEPDAADTYISDTGTVQSSRELERGAWEHSAPTDLTEDPVVVNGVKYFPVTTHSTFEITYEFCSEIRSDIAAAITRLTDHSRTEDTGVLTSSTRDCSSPEIRFIFLTPDGRESRVMGAEDIRSVKPIASLSQHFETAGVTVPDRAELIEEYASMHPYTVTPDDIIELFRTSSDPDVIRSAVAALRHIIVDREGECSHTTHHLRDVLLNQFGTGVTRDALYCVADIAESTPEDAAVAVDAVPSHITDDTPSCREHALRACAASAEHTTTHIIGYEEDIADCLATGSESERIHAAKTLAEHAVEHPTHVTPHVEPLVNRLSTSVSNVEEEVAVMSALGRISRHDPSNTIGSLQIIATGLNSPHEKVRANTASTLYEIAERYPDDVAEYTDEIASLLSAETEYARMNATGALARLARTSSELVGPHSTSLCECLTASRKETRLNTCTVFENLQGTVQLSEDVKSALQLLSETDPDEEVQTRAYRALPHYV